MLAKKNLETSSEEETEQPEKFRFFKKTKNLQKKWKKENLNTKMENVGKFGIEDAEEAFEENSGKLKEKSGNFEENLDIERFFDCDENSVKISDKNRKFWNFFSTIVDFFTNLFFSDTKKFFGFGRILILIFSILIFQHSAYSTGFLSGLIAFKIYKFFEKNFEKTENRKNLTDDSDFSRIFEIEPIEECQHFEKTQGWLNEYSAPYDAQTYKIARTHPVFARLSGHTLRMARAKDARARIPKRATWREPEFAHEPFDAGRALNMRGAHVFLLPRGLARIRRWSKKYPICVEFAQEDPRECDFEMENSRGSDFVPENLQTEDKEKKGMKNEDFSVLAQRFSKLIENEDLDFDSDSEEETEKKKKKNRKNNNEKERKEKKEENEKEEEIEEKEEEENEKENEEEKWENCLTEQKEQKEKIVPIRLYLFGRTDRDKEHWYRKLAAATHKSVFSTPKSDFSTPKSAKSVFSPSRPTFTTPKSALSTNQSEKSAPKSAVPTSQSAFSTPKSTFSATESAIYEEKTAYLKLMQNLLRRSKKSADPMDEKHSRSTKNSSNKEHEEEGEEADEVLEEKEEEETVKKEEDNEEEKENFLSLVWLNALLSRVLFDFVRNEDFIEKIKIRIQRKLGAIKLPFFIEELLCTELSLGRSVPTIRKIGSPIVNERGLWIDFDVDYCGSILITLQTKLDLMRLKNPHAYEKSPLSKLAIYHSDVDDTAESSSDDSDADANAAAPATDDPQKKTLLSYVAESRFFQAATENRYIKKAMEGVSNTDLRLTVEVNAISGVLCLNVPEPPADRIWIGFRPVPDLSLTVRPAVGERNFNYQMLTNWIEKKLLMEFQKILVIPNMEDLIIPAMNPNFPD